MSKEIQKLNQEKVENPNIYRKRKRKKIKNTTNPKAITT